MPLDTLVSSPARLASANRGKGIQENQFLSYRLDSLSLRAFGPSAGNDAEFRAFEAFFNNLLRVMIGGGEFVEYSHIYQTKYLSIFH